MSFDIMDFAQRLEAWVGAQLWEHQHQRLDKEQQPQQGDGRSDQQGRHPPRLPQPILFSEGEQHAFRRAIYQSLRLVDPEVLQQQVFQQYQLQGQQPDCNRGYEQQQQQQKQQQQAYQQQVQQQQAQLLCQPQHQPQAEREPRRNQARIKHDQETGPKAFSTRKADYFVIKRVAHSSEGTVSLARSTAIGKNCIVKSVRSDGNTPREAFMLNAAGPHPNIVRMFEAVFDTCWGLAHMCLEYCSDGDLHELQCRWGAQNLPVPNQIILQAIVNVSDGLAFLHRGWIRDEKTGIYQTTANARRIIHRDLVRNLRGTLQLLSVY
jgi:hypothetical protein